MDTGPELVLQHALRDGTRVTVRHIQPSDRDALREAFHGLSPESRYRRFFSAVRELDERTLRYLCDVDGVDHVALVCVTESPDLKTERGVGVVRFLRVKDEPRVAEIAVTVTDDYQRRGVGTLLLLTAIRAARERGITHFRGEVLASNAATVALLRESGALTRATEGTLVFDLPIAEERSLLGALRVAARQVGTFLRGLFPP